PHEGLRGRPVRRVRPADAGAQRGVLQVRYVWCHQRLQLSPPLAVSRGPRETASEEPTPGKRNSPMVYLSRIYTKSGDQGETGLGDGTRVPKDHPRVAAYGSVDELNAALGLLLAHAPDQPEAAL